MNNPALGFVLVILGGVFLVSAILGTTGKMLQGLFNGIPSGGTGGGAGSTRTW